MKAARYLALLVLSHLAVAEVAAAPRPYQKRSADNQTTDGKSTSQFKPPLEIADLESDAHPKWAVIAGAEISNDGRYVVYQVSNQPPGTAKLVIQATQSDRKWELSGANNISLLTLRFSSDSREALFIAAKDQLCRLELGKETQQCVPNVSRFDLRQYSGEDWLVYQSTDADHRLFIRRLADTAAVSVSCVKSFTFSSDGSTLAVLRKSSHGEANSESVELFDLRDGKQKTIWHGEQADSIVLSGAGSRVAFIATEKKGDKTVHSIWSYRSGQEGATVIADDHAPELTNGLTLGKVDRFGRSNAELFITLKSPPIRLQDLDSKAVQVDVWSYKDPKPQSQQLNELGRAVPPFQNVNVIGAQQGSYAAVINLETHRILQLQDEDEEIKGFPDINDDYVVIRKVKGNRDEAYWNSFAKPTYYVESTKSGVRREIPSRSMGISGDVKGITADGKYLILSDQYARTFFSYEMSSGIVRNISHNIPIPSNHDPDYGKRWVLLMAARIEGSSSVLMYDKYDIWQIDASGKSEPINITNGYGRRNHIVFRLAGGYGLGQEVADNGSLLLAAFNERTKDNGFYRKALGTIGNPTLLTTGPYLYSEFIVGSYGHPFSPLKAKHADIYVVQRESAEESPNYFWTSNWYTFHALSDVHPERNYNWLTSQLISWKTFDGTTTQGVLYKPENFDPHKKYPVIVYFYETKSENVHLYEPPRTTSAQLQFSWLVSNGYVVFTPDIHYRTGEIGQCAYNDVVSGVEYIGKMPWVDRKRISIAGHSFGGFEVDYLVTHTNMFAAALSGAGISDFASAYLSVMSSGEGLQSFTERKQDRMNATLWGRPDAYIVNSAVFRADKVSTPLLMMNNNQDGMVGFLQQGLAWFLALRRAGKKVWMLEYDGEDHSLSKDENAFDYTIRVKQFFDYYLKGAPAPVWMTRGVPACLKGIDSGLESDTSGTKP